MKFLMILSLLALTFGCNADTNKTENAVTATKVQALDANGKPEEDCDDKAKKTVEIKEESISLGGGDAGCTLEEAGAKPKL